MGTQCWTHLLANDWVAMSTDLKNNYTNTNQLEYLHSSYLIDSVTTPSNKYQSINFLVD